MVADNIWYHIRVRLCQHLLTSCHIFSMLLLSVCDYCSCAFRFVGDSNKIHWESTCTTHWLTDECSPILPPHSSSHSPPICFNTYCSTPMYYNIAYMCTKHNKYLQQKNSTYLPDLYVTKSQKKREWMVIVSPKALHIKILIFENCLFQFHIKFTLHTWPRYYYQPFCNRFYLFPINIALKLIYIANFFNHFSMVIIFSFCTCICGVLLYIIFYQMNFRRLFNVVSS